MSTDELKYAVEALLFASDRPLTPEDLCDAFESGVSAGDIRGCVEELQADYQAQGRGFRLFEIAGGFQIVTDTRFEPYLKKFYAARMKKRLSQATLETLSIIAYRQPVTRADMEFIRGVNVDGALKTLLEKGMVRVVGKKEVPGRPMLYGTTTEFLEHFGLASIKDLPPLTEFSEKDLDPNLLPPQLKEEEISPSGAGEEALSEGAAQDPDKEAHPDER